MSVPIHQRHRKKTKKGAAYYRDYLFVTTASLIIHGLVLLVVSMIPPDEPAYKKKEVVLTTEFDDPMLEELELPDLMVEVPELDELVDIDLSELTEEQEAEVPQEELVDVEPLEDEPLDPDDGLDGLDVMEDFDPNESGAGLDSLAMLETNTSGFKGDGIPSAYSGRSKGEKRKKTKAYGGTESVLSSVDRALEWLAHHQNPQGYWDRMVEAKKPDDKKSAKKVEAKAVDEKVAEPKEKKAKVLGKAHYRASITASAVLAFLGAGHNENSGPYKKNVRKAIRYLNAYVSQLKEGRVIDKNYGSAIVLMALSESSIFGSSPVTRRSAERLAKDLLDMYRGQGWGYSKAGDDFSVSGWIALGLKSARQAEVPYLTDEKMAKLFKDYGKWVNEMTDPKTGEGNYRNGKKGSIAMSWVGMFQKQFLGFPHTDAFLIKAAELGIKRIPKTMNLKKMTWKDEYSLYYGTLAAFQHQGTFWKEWNQVMKVVLPTTQRDGDVAEFGGSWDSSSSHIGESGGRVMTTALLTLCLEVYYRYAMMH